MARWLVEHDGIFVGSSSAVNCKSSRQSMWLARLTLILGVAATKLAKALGPGHRIVTLLCDR
jgi:cysteine synthase A